MIDEWTDNQQQQRLQKIKCMNRRIDMDVFIFIKSTEKIDKCRQ